MARALVAIEAGKVYLPAERPWLPELLNELSAFPFGDYDDQVDALSQAVWFFVKPYNHNRHNPKNRARVITRW